MKKDRYLGADEARSDLFVSFTHGDDLKVDNSDTWVGRAWLGEVTATGQRR